MAGPSNIPDNMGQTQGTASSATKGIKEAASNLGQKAQEMASAATERAGDALGSVGQGMSNLAGTIRQNVPREGMLGSAAGTVAEGLETGGRYLREHDLGDIGEDLGRLVRQHPVPALLTVFGIGFLLGSALRR
jgi:methyl-accepting chemotaxis protein